MMTKTFHSFRDGLSSLCRVSVSAAQALEQQYRAVGQRFGRSNPSDVRNYIHPSFEFADMESCAEADAVGALAANVLLAARKQVARPYISLACGEVDYSTPDLQPFGWCWIGARTAVVFHVGYDVMEEADGSTLRESALAEGWTETQCTGCGKARPTTWRNHIPLCETCAAAHDARRP